jgi:spore maturation protein SpmB
LVVSGIIDGVGGVLGFAPLIMFMFFAIAILEDSGYMARVAYLLDRVLRTFGLHGNSVIGLIVGGGISGGCAVPGIMATRTLKDPQARLATILVVPFMNCGAKLPVYSVLIAAFFAGAKGRDHVRPDPYLLEPGPFGGQGFALHPFGRRAGALCHGAAALPHPHHQGPFDPHLGAHLAVCEKGRHRDPGGQHPGLGPDDLPLPARGSGGRDI